MSFRLDIFKATITEDRARKTIDILLTPATGALHQGLEHFVSSSEGGSVKGLPAWKWGYAQIFFLSHKLRISGFLKVRGHSLGQLKTTDVARILFLFIFKPQLLPSELIWLD